MPDDTKQPGLHIIRAEGDIREWHVTKAAPGSELPIRTICGVTIRWVNSHGSFDDSFYTVSCGRCHRLMQRAGR
jgi:hypothetical protein